MLRQFLPGKTYSLIFDFFDDAGNRTAVENPTTDFYDPYRQPFLTGVAGVTVSGYVGRYTSPFYSTPGLTIGQYFGLCNGLTNGFTVFASQEPFELISPFEEPLWIGLRDFREYIQADDTDHTKDSFYNQCIQTSMDLVEGYTRRKYLVQAYNELYEVKRTDRVMLMHFPVQMIAGLTATVRIIPRSQTQVIEILQGNPVPFHYLLDAGNGILHLTDMAGFDQVYDQLLIAISYWAGYPTLPDAVRSAALSIASSLVNLATTEGISNLRLADLSFAIDKGIIDGKVKELLAPFRNVGDIGSQGIGYSGIVPQHSF